MHFHAGAGFIGTDWCAVKWIGLDGESMLVSDPLKFRKLMDKIELYSSAAAIRTASTVAGASIGDFLGGLIGTTADPPGTAAMAAAGAFAGTKIGAAISTFTFFVLSNVFSDALLTDIDTEGFKMLTLRAED